MAESHADAVKDECYRCGYDLRGIANEGACPECGLVAERSRRVSDELHNTRPRWLRSLSWGINLILLAILAPIGGGFASTVFEFYLRQWFLYPVFLGPFVGALLLFFGVILLTRREGYAPADRGDRRLRYLLRIMAALPGLAMGGLYLALYYANSGNFFDELVIWWPVFFLIISFLPLLLFLRLRGLARRARSAHLEEHCNIVGIGTFASILYMAGVTIMSENAERWGFRTNWENEPISLIMVLVMSVASCLFLLWSLYLLVRFAVAFWIAAHELRRKWTRDDRSLTT